MLWLLDYKTWALGAAFLISSLLGLQEYGRFASYRATVAAIGKAQDERTATRIESDRQTKERIDRDHKARVATLNRDLAVAKLRERAGSSLLPTVPTAPPGSGGGEADRGIVCFSRERLSQGLSASLQRFAGQLEGSIQRGASAIAGFESCALWAIEEAAKPR